MISLSLNHFIFINFSLVSLSETNLINLTLSLTQALGHGSVALMATISDWINRTYVTIHEIN